MPNEEEMQGRHEEGCGCSEHHEEHGGPGRHEGPHHHHDEGPGEGCGCGGHGHGGMGWGGMPHPGCNCPWHRMGMGGMGMGRMGMMDGPRMSGMAPWRRFVSREEILACLEEYLKQLQMEEKAVQERIETLKKREEPPQA